MLQSISMEKALEIFQEYASTVGMEEISITDSFERILAEDIVAGFPLPPFCRSPLDGYALYAADTAGADKVSPASLRVTQSIYAGEMPTKPLLAGETAAVTTGAPLPEGSDTVIKFEDICRRGIQSQFVLLFGLEKMSFHEEKISPRVKRPLKEEQI